MTTDPDPGRSKIYGSGWIQNTGNKSRKLRKTHLLRVLERVNKRDSRIREDPPVEGAGEGE
jgi:hypothetical protein